MKWVIRAGLGATVAALVTCIDPGPVRARAEQGQSKGQERNAGWLRGKWAFDEEFTAEKNRDSKDNEGVGGVVVAQLMGSLKGSRINITDREVIFMLAGGNGKAERYEVLEVPDAATVTLKGEDGKLTTYHKEGERFWINSTGNVRVPFYFKREKSD